MKKLIVAAFIAFWASIGTLVAINAMAPEAPDVEPAALPGYTMAQIAEHNTRDSCWMAIEGQVYDFTGYIPEHSTPAFVMERWCGREATEGMRTKGYGPDHSPAAWAMMAPYLIGVLIED